ncbi:MAG TPA: AI-2E family transporter [Anaerolineae bacterium]|nr:AI-2E family transporter [Anaerolineae bacterium]
MTNQNSSDASPPWGSTVKLVIGFTVVGIIGAFLVRFKNLIGPLLLVFILSYLLHPLAKRLSEKTRLSWRMSVNIIFIILIIILLTSATAIGLVVIQQLQSLINAINDIVGNLPQAVMDLSTQEIHIGNYVFNFSSYFNTNNIETVLQKLLEIIQPMLGRAGGILSSMASSTATSIGWTFFIAIISYFLLADLGDIPDVSRSFNIPGYDKDFKRLWHELLRIWNAFLRGQFVLFVFTAVIYAILMGLLGVKYVLAIAIIAGLARFIPYAGAWITWIIIALVSLFQSGNYFGLENWQFMLVVLGVGFIVDTIFDNFIAPRILGKSLGVNPALVLLAAIIGANLIGLIGVLLAAPVLATLKLFGQYITRKMLDMPPFPEPEQEIEPLRYPWVVWGEKFWSWIIQKARLIIKKGDSQK